MIFNFSKIAVIGCGGSGKSYFSLKLSKILNIPCYHLDRFYWKPNWEKISNSEFSEIVNDISNKDEWIIDGNYSNTMEIRFKKADLIVFMDMPTELCLKSEKERRGTKREDLPEYLEETEDPIFINYITTFNKEHREKIFKLMKKFPKVKTLIFTSREAVNAFFITL